MCAISANGVEGGGAPRWGNLGRPQVVNPVRGDSDSQDLGLKLNKTYNLKIENGMRTDTHNLEFCIERHVQILAPKFGKSSFQGILKIAKPILQFPIQIQYCNSNADIQKNA